MKFLIVARHMDGDKRITKTVEAESAAAALRLVDGAFIEMGYFVIDVRPEQRAIDELLAALRESKGPKRDALLKLYGELATMG